MASRIHVRLAGISQEAEFRIGGSGNRLSDEFVPANSPFAAARNRAVALLQSWMPGVQVSWERMVDIVDGWCSWSGNTSAQAACAYDSNTDTFSDAARMAGMRSAIENQFAAYGSDPDFWLFAGLWVRTNWSGTGIVTVTDSLQQRMVEYVKGRLESAWTGAGGSLSRFRFFVVSQRNVAGGEAETWRKFRLMNSFAGLDFNTGVPRLPRMVVPWVFGVGNADGVHNWESQNHRIGEAAALAISAEVGGPNFLGADGPPRFGRWWKTSPTTAVVPLFHGNGARAIVPPGPTPAPALRFGTSINAGGTTTLTVDSVDTSQAANGRTLFYVSAAGGIPDTCWLTNNEGGGGTLSEIMLDYTPGGTWTRADYDAFTDIYTAVSPSIVRPMIQQVPIALSNPNEAWNGARTPHPSAPSGPPTVTLTDATDLGNGSIRARFAASGGVTMVRASLRRLSDNTVVATVRLPITTAAEHIFSGLAPSPAGYRVEYAWQRSATVAVTVL
jgi:hypothetical protein